MAKIDMEHAYDRMRWEFVEGVLHCFGFNEKWCRWVKACLSRPSFAALVNGSAISWFESRMGLRQGCPLSPYIFILCSEMPSLKLKYLTNSGSIRGFQPCVNNSLVCHLLYAGDCLIFSKATPQNADRVTEAIDQYCQISEQGVNLAKSIVVFSPCLHRRHRMRIASIMRMQQQEGSWVYLGVPLSISIVKHSDFNHIIAEKWMDLQPSVLQGR